MPTVLPNVWLAHEAEDRCRTRSLIKTPDRISERPPRGGLSVLGSGACMIAYLFGLNVTWSGYSTD
jgi:hypothetical protein